MARMDIFTYTALSAPDDAMKLLSQHSRLRPSDPQELAHTLKQVYKNLRNDEREDFLVQLASIHPDRELLSETMAPTESDRYDNDSKMACPYCGHRHAIDNQISQSHVIGTHVGANGLHAVNHFMTSGQVPPHMQTPNTMENRELNSLKNQNMFRDMLNDRIFKIAMLGAIVFLIWKSVKK